jgi:hypothetical protein
MKVLHVLLGLGGLGLAYLVLRPKTAAAAPAGGAAPAAPAAPNAGVPTPDGLMLVGDPMHLISGQQYSGRLNLLKAALPPFSSDATNDTLVKGLSALGWTGAKVYMTLAELPAGWPPSTTVNPSAGTRWFTGVWSEATADISKPYELEQLWMKTP